MGRGVQLGQNLGATLPAVLRFVDPIWQSTTQNCRILETISFRMEFWVCMNVCMNGMMTDVWNARSLPHRQTLFGWDHQPGFLRWCLSYRDHFGLRRAGWFADVIHTPWAQHVLSCKHLLQQAQAFWSQSCPLKMEPRLRVAIWVRWSWSLHQRPWKPVPRSCWWRDVWIPDVATWWVRHPWWRRSVAANGRSCATSACAMSLLCSLFW